MCGAQGHAAGVWSKDGSPRKERPELSRRGPRETHKRVGVILDVVTCAELVREDHAVLVHNTGGQ